MAAQLSFRRVYHGVPSIGGRYSALSDFGLVPHAAMGLDTEKFLERTALMVEACKASSAMENPGVALGLILGMAATKFGRTKLRCIVQNRSPIWALGSSSYSPNRPESRATA